jgi:hypothetical protein
MHKSRCKEVFRGADCPRCKKRFYICRHCDRGHVYCCRQCFIASRSEKCRRYRRQFRLSSEGMADHRAHERARRQRRRLVTKSVGDHGSQGGVQTAKVSAPVRLAAAVAAILCTGGEATTDGYVYCELCGCRSKFVCFGGGTRREKNRMRVFRYSG